MKVSKTKLLSLIQNQNLKEIIEVCNINNPNNVTRDILRIQDWNTLKDYVECDNLPLFLTTIETAIARTGMDYIYAAEGLYEILDNNDVEGFMDIFGINALDETTNREYNGFLYYAASEFMDIKILKFLVINHSDSILIKDYLRDMILNDAKRKKLFFGGLRYFYIKLLDTLFDNKPNDIGEIMENGDALIHFLARYSRQKFILMITKMHNFDMCQKNKNNRTPFECYMYNGELRSMKMHYMLFVEPDMDVYGKYKAHYLSDLLISEEDIETYRLFKLEYDSEF